MTIFRLKQLASTSVHAAADAVRWNYDRAEMIADGVVHGVGVFFGLVAATVLIVLTAIYASALDIAVVPSHWEGFGLVAAEALLAETPVVASNVSSLPEIITEAIHGALVPPKNPSST